MPASHPSPTTPHTNTQRFHNKDSLLQTVSFGHYHTCLLLGTEHFTFSTQVSVSPKLPPKRQPINSSFAPPPHFWLTRGRGNKPCMTGDCDHLQMWCKLPQKIHLSQIGCSPQCRLDDQSLACDSSATSCRFAFALPTVITYLPACALAGGLDTAYMSQYVQALLQT